MMSDKGVLFCAFVCLQGMIAVSAASYSAKCVYNQQQYDPGTENQVDTCLKLICDENAQPTLSLTCCIYEEKPYPVGPVDIDKCFNCNCTTDGTIKCQSVSPCPVYKCQDGQVLAEVAGQCCKQCVAQKQ